MGRGGGKEGGGGGIVIWICFSFPGKSKIAVLKCSSDFTKYEQTLRNYFCPFAEVNHEEEVILQQSMPTLTRII